MVVRSKVAAVLLLAVVAGCTCREAIEVPVASPEGPQTQAPTYARFQLSQPLYDPSQPLDQRPQPVVTVQPVVPFRASWSSPHSVDVDFPQPLPPATEFAVTLAKGLATVDGKAELRRSHTLRFQTPLNRLEQVASINPDASVDEAVTLGFQATTGEVAALGPRQDLKLTFRYPVTKAQAEKLVEVRQKGGAALNVPVTMPADPGTEVILDPPGGAGTWPRNATLVVTVREGLGVAQPGAGPLVTKTPVSQEIRTWGPTTVRMPARAENACVSVKHLELRFNNPVSCARVLPSIETDVDTELKCVSHRIGREVRIEAVPPFPGDRQVTVFARAGLTDEFGERLERDEVLQFQTCAPGVQFAYQRPFVILDPGQPPTHEERVFGAHQVRVEAAKLTVPQAWKVVHDQGLTDQVAWTELPWWLQEGHFDWYDSGRTPGEISSNDIPELDGAQTVTVPVEPSAWTNVPVGLEPFLGESGRGIVLMRATPLGADGRASGQPVLRIVNVSDIGLSVRASKSTLLVLAASYSTGKPLEGVRLTVLSESGARLGEGRTGADGLMRLPVSELGGTGELDTMPLLVVAEKAGDTSFVWSRFVVEPSMSWGDVNLVGLVYPDRGIYRPGETVRLRAVARYADATGFAPTAGQSGKLVVYDAKRTKLLDQDVTLSDWGSVEGLVELPPAAPVGYYEATLQIGQNSLGTSFLVGEFRRAEMKVEVQAPPQVVLGDTLQAMIQGDYLFGAPASGLGLSWSLSRSTVAYKSRRFAEATFNDPNQPEWAWYDDGAVRTSLLADGTAKLDDKGSYRLVHRLNLPPPVSQHETIRISATVEDANGQTVSRTTNVDLYSADVLVGVQASRYLFETNKPFPVTLVAVTTEDAPAKNVEVRLLSRQTTWRSVRRAGPGGGFYWTSERIVENDVERCRGRTDDQGRFSCTFTPDKGGSLQLVAEAKDAKGRSVQAGSWHWGYGDPDFWGESSDTPTVAVLFDRNEVEAGEKARIAITSPFKEGQALVTIEREDILWQKSFPIGTSATLEVPTEIAWAPNVHVVATVVRGRVPANPDGSDPERDKPAYAIGRRELIVRPSARALEVKVAVAKPKVEPGQQQVASVVVKTADGKPAADTEVNLWAVDEGVLMLTGYQTPDLMAAMYSPRSYRTLGLDTRAYVLGKRLFVQPVVKGEEDGGGGGDESDTSVRKNFDPLAVWTATAITDAQGRVELPFNVPDSLTTYRVMAVVVSKDDRFGHGDTQFKVNKTLMLRQALPRFARPGDRFQAGVLVNHLLDKPGRVTVSLARVDEKLFKVTGQRQVEIEVNPGQTLPVLFDIEAFDVDGAAEIQFEASMEGYRDRVELKIPVNRLQPRESIAAAGVLSSGEVTHEMKLPPLARPVNFDVNLSAFPVSSMEGRLRDLVRYPYGCLEQRTSQVMPLVAVRKLADELNMASIPTDQIKGWVDEYLAEVPKFRCSDGGFDYWEGCSYGSSTYLTTFALEGMLTARRFGYVVDQGEIDRTVEYLQRQVRAGSKGRDQFNGHGHEDAAFTAALRVLAEAGKPLPEIEKASFESRANLPLFAKTDLVRAMGFRLGAAASADSSVKTLLQEIAQEEKRRGDRITFDADNPERYWWAWESRQRNTALVLRALVEIVPADGRIPFIIKGLVDLDGASRYYVTQDVAQTLLGLASAVSMMKPEKDSPKATVVAGTHELASAEPVGAAVRTLSLSPGQIGETLPLKIANNGAGPLFYGAFLTYAYPATARLPARSAGFTLRREYLGQDGKPLALAAPGRLELRAGDIVRVRVNVHAEERGRLVVFEDSLPAGLEVLDTRLATTDQAAVERMGGDKQGSWWYRSHRELRDDRVEWHFEEVPAGRFALTYLARATTPGTYHAPGPHAERMYQPEINGRGAPLDVTVLPKGR